MKNVKVERYINFKLPLIFIKNLKLLNLNLYFLVLSLSLNLILIDGTKGEEILKLPDVNIKGEVKYPKEKAKDIYTEDINLDRDIDISQILSKSYPEINVIRKGATANDVNIRGLDKENINIIIDNSRIYNACPNRMDPPIFHVKKSEIQEINIIEGAFDVETGNSLGGTVYIKTKEPEFNNLNGDFNLTVGSFSYFDSSLKINGGNKNIGVLVGIEKSYSKVYKTGEGKYFTEYLTGKSAYKQNKIDGTAFDINHSWIKIKAILNNENELAVNYRYDYSQNILYPYLKMDAMSDMTNSLDINFTNKPLSLEISTYYNLVKHDMQDRYRISSLNSANGYDWSMRTYAKTETKGFKITKVNKFGTTKLKTGIEGYIRNWKANNTIALKSKIFNNSGMIPDVDLKNVGIFIKGLKRIGKTDINIGIRYDIFSSKSTISRLGADNRNLFQTYYGLNNLNENKDFYISGNILFKHQFSKNLSIYLGYGHSVRVPSPEERYIAIKKPDKPKDVPDWIGNPNLKPTKNDEIDIGFNINTRKVYIKADVFYNKLKDFIYLNTIKKDNLTAQSYKNIDASIYGSSINAYIFFNDNFRIETGVAYQRGIKINGNYKDKDLAEIPPLKFKLALEYNKDNFTGIIENIYSKGQKHTDSTLKEVNTSPYYVVNIKGIWKIKNKLSFNLGIDNLFNNMYYTHLSYLRNPFATGSKVPEIARFIYMNFTYEF